jgi:plastocyanin
MVPRPCRAAAGALVLLLAAACGGGSDSTEKTGTDQKINDGGAADASARDSVAVTAENFRFSPSAITGKPGQVLKLVVRNASGTKHNITQEAQGVDEDLDAGATKTVTLTVPASGRLVFVCEYHASSGMAGSIGPAGSAAPSSSEAATTGYDPYGGG